VDTEARTDALIERINRFVLAPKVTPDLKRFILDEFAGTIVFGSIPNTKRPCQFEDERHASKQTDALIAALDPFLNAAIPHEEKVEILNLVIDKIVPRLRGVTRGRQKLAEEGDECGKRRRPTYLC